MRDCSLGPNKDRNSQKPVTRAELKHTFDLMQTFIFKRLYRDDSSAREMSRSIWIVHVVGTPHSGVETNHKEAPAQISE